MRPIACVGVDFDSACGGRGPAQSQNGNWAAYGQFMGNWYEEHASLCVLRCACARAVGCAVCVVVLSMLRVERERVCRCHGKCAQA